MRHDYMTIRDWTIYTCLNTWLYMIVHMKDIIHGSEQCSLSMRAYQSNFLLWSVGFTFWPWGCQFQIGYFGHSLLIHKRARLWTWKVDFCEPRWSKGDPKRHRNGCRFSPAGWFPCVGTYLWGISHLHTQGGGFPKSYICQISPNSVSAPAGCLDTSYLIRTIYPTSSSPPLTCAC